MGRLKSLIIQTQIDVAGKAHNCQANAAHRIVKGEVRLKVRNGLGWDHYCQTCAQAILAKDIEKIQRLQQLRPELDSDL